MHHLVNCSLLTALLFIGIGIQSSRSDDKGASATPRKLEFAMALHGGAGSPGKLANEELRAYKLSLERALKIGVQVLRSGGTSLDAIEKVIRHLEDDPRFNAGRGAVFNSEGGHELDASIMDGRTKACGAVAGVKTVKNPISLARLVMTQTRHVLLAGEGADKFAVEMDVDRVDQKYFWTEKRFQSWKKAQQRERDKAGEKHKGTVGCVALDQHGNLAAGTSTGGLTNKKFGRIGDSPIVGAGTYADNKTCAVSCTGIGEHFIRNAVAYDVSALMAYKKLSVQKAVETVIHHKLKKDDGGIIAVAHDGSIWMDFNTEGMARAAADSTGRFEVYFGK